ncbi:MAG: nucleotidyltransferase family protein [Anaerotruncus sp.]|nr:MAG: nucleotidyltransferase family protein [Anaerotruncus sp.]
MPFTINSPERKRRLKNGADLVIELPPEQALLSAEGFATSAVKLAESLGIIDEIAFGAENADTAELKKSPSCSKTQKVQGEISREMKSGISYPAARNKIIKSPLLEKPNNILAIEYIKAASIPCRAIKRIGKGHDTDDEKYSASAIRKALSPDEISTMQNCEKAVLFKLRSMSKEDFSKIADVNEGLENRIYEAARNAASLDELYALIKSKRYTLSRVKRIVLRAFLDIYESETDVPAIRILGFNESGRALLADIKAKCDKPIISRLADCEGDLREYYLNQCAHTDAHSLGYKKLCPAAQSKEAK